MAVGPPVDDKLDECIQIVIFAVDLAVDTRQILGLHQLELVPDRGYDAA